jgi:hypothetical protein
MAVHEQTRAAVAGELPAITAGAAMIAAISVKRPNRIVASLVAETI